MTVTNVEAVRVYHNRVRAENRKLMESYKLAQGCVDCGYRSDVRALQFDHVVPRRFRHNIAARLHTRKVRQELLEECEVVCANCHSIRSAVRGQDGRKQ